MPRAEPLITPEELQCLLGSAHARSVVPGGSLRQNMQRVHFGAALWLVKGVFLYWVLMSPEAGNLVSTGRYVWMRGGLELLCLAVFWGGSLHPRGRTLVNASMLVASTTLLMDAMNLLAIPG